MVALLLASMCFTESIHISYLVAHVIEEHSEGRQSQDQEGRAERATKLIMRARLEQGLLG